LIITVFKIIFLLGFLIILHEFAHYIVARNCGVKVNEFSVGFGKKIFHVSVFSIEKESIAGGVIEDITAPQVQKHRIVSQARKVIDKNLSVVQKIAYLLGENAAETESILNSIIQSFSEDEEDEDWGIYEWVKKNFYRSWSLSSL